MSGRLSIIAHLEVTRISPSDDLQRPLADRGNYWVRSQVVRGLLKLKATKVTKRLLGADWDMGMFPRGMMCEWGWGVCVMCAIWAEVFRSFIPGQRTRCDIRPSSHMDVYTTYQGTYHPLSPPTKAHHTITTSHNPVLYALSLSLSPPPPPLNAPSTAPCLPTPSGQPHSTAGDTARRPDMKAADVGGPGTWERRRAGPGATLTGPVVILPTADG